GDLLRRQLHRVRSGPQETPRRGCRPAAPRALQEAGAVSANRTTEPQGSVVVSGGSMKGFNHYLFWLSSLALFGVCGLYFSFYPSPAWKVLSVPCSLALGGGLYAWLARRERFSTLFGLETAAARWQLHLTLGALLALVVWGALQVPVAALYTQWLGDDAE